MYIMYIYTTFTTFLNPPPLFSEGLEGASASDASVYLFHIVPMWEDKGQSLSYLATVCDLWGRASCPSRPRSHPLSNTKTSMKHMTSFVCREVVASRVVPCQHFPKTHERFPPYGLPPIKAGSIDIVLEML